MKYMSIAIVGVVSVNAFTISDIKDAVKSQDFQPITDDVNSMIDGVVGDLKDKKTNFFDDLKDKIMDTDAYAKVDDWYSNWEPTSYHDTQRWAQEHIKRVDKPEAHVMSEHRNVHHRVSERRAASGRPPMMTVAQIHNLGNKDTYKQTVDMWLQYDGIDNIANTLYSFFTGFIYTPGQQTACSEDILTYFSAWVNSIDTIKKIYLPYNWPNFQVVMQDIIASGSGLV